MNANEAIGKIRFMLDVGGSDGFTSADKEALNMAINALSAEITAPPKSNADRIRQMTDEELVMALDTDCNRCAKSENCELFGDPVSYGICVKGNIEWLRKEVSEDAKMVENA